MKAPSRFPALVATAVLLAVHAFPARGGELPVKVEETQLANGLKVFCLKRPGLPQAACALGVRVGGVNETPGYTGMAHFLEHMMFKGSDKIGVKDAEDDRKLRVRIDRVMEKILALEDAGAPDDEIAPLREKRDRLFDEQEKNLEVNHIFRIYGEAGGAMTNAFTSNDMTVYFCTLPPQKIELFFWIEGERFSRPVFRQFHAEKEVVREERRLAENRPGHAYREELNRVIFGDHPYGHPVLGSHEDLRRLTRQDMRRFFDTHYAPDNMFLLVAGDVDPQDVFRLARKYFGKMKPLAGNRPRVPTLHV
ncbi:MAG: M16 family metallopeptidase, partial [Planctomycetota bacterium]